MPFQSALFFGRVLHRRTRPRAHTLRYRIFSMLFDLDELPELPRRLRLFSYNRFNLFSFYDRDHGPGQAGPLRPYVESLMREAGLQPDGGPIRLLCSPRILGAAFNPLNTYFCHRRDGTLAAMLYEVNNTFGQRHSYMIPAVEPGEGAEILQSCGKEFYVSPFMDMAMTYRFRVVPPAKSVSVCIQTDDSGGTVLFAAFTGHRAELSDMRLLATFLRYPLLAAKVLGGIHWEALKLWRKGVGLRPRPALPHSAVTVIPLQSL